MSFGLRIMNTVCWVNIQVEAVARSLPVLCHDTLMNPAVLAYFSSTNMASRSESTLASHSRAILYLYDSLGSKNWRELDGGAPAWLAILGSYLAGEPGAHDVGLRAARYLRFLVDDGVLVDPRSGQWRAANADAVASSGHRRSYSILGHIHANARDHSTGAPLSTPARERTDPTGRSVTAASRSRQTPAAFPERHVAAFFLTGLLKPDGEAILRAAARGEGCALDAYNARDMVYFLPLAFGATRSSDVLHAYVSDIERDGELGFGANLFLHHPVTGAAPRTGSYDRGQPTTRETYLRQVYGLRPRNLVTGYHRVGWKDLLLNEPVERGVSRTRVYWQSPEIGELFWLFHEIYVNGVRPRTTSHPYYYVSLSPSTYGAPWTLGASKDRFDAAVRRIGLEPDAMTGICRHAFRHRIGHWLVRAGVHPAITQIIMHHKSVASQVAYMNLPPADVSAALTAAAGDGSWRPAEDGPGAMRSPWRGVNQDVLAHAGRDVVGRLLGRGL